MNDKDAAERVMAVIERHADTVTLDLLLDLAKALNLRLTVKLIDDGTNPAEKRSAA